MANPDILAVLFYGHILSATGWLGGGLLTAFVIGPGIGSLSPAANMEFIAKVVPGIVRFIEVMVGSTFLFGILLYLYVGYTPAFGGSWLLYTGIGLALVAAAVVFGLTVPSFRELVRMAQERVASPGAGHPQAEALACARRARQGTLVVSILLLVVLAGMVGATLGL